MNGRRVSKKEAQKRLNDAGRKLKIIEYTCMREPATFECECGHIFTSRASNVIRDYDRVCMRCHREHYKHSDESRQKISAGNQRMWDDPVRRADRIEKSISKEANSKRRESMKKWWSCSQNKEKMRGRKRAKSFGWTADTWIEDGITELYLYIVEFVGTGLFKIGITQNPKQRYRKFPLETKPLAEIKGSTRVIFDMEKELKRQHKPYRVKGKSLLAEFNGGTEVFSKLIGYSTSN